MTLLQRMQALVEKDEIASDQFYQFINGDATTDVTTTSGQVIPSLAKIAATLLAAGVNSAVFLPNVTGLTGGGASKLDGAIPSGLTSPKLFDISPQAGIPAIGLPVDGKATYKLRPSTTADVVDGLNYVQPTAYSSAWILARVA